MTMTFMPMTSACKRLCPLVIRMNSDDSVLCSTKVFRRCKASGAMLDIVDACSLLYRLEMDGKI